VELSVRGVLIGALPPFHEGMAELKQRAVARQYRHSARLVQHLRILADIRTEKGAAVQEIAGRDHTFRRGPPAASGTIRKFPNPDSIFC
jgi:hypothetical protein